MAAPKGCSSEVIVRKLRQADVRVLEGKCITYSLLTRAQRSGATDASSSHGSSDSQQAHNSTHGWDRKSAIVYGGALIEVKVLCEERL